MEWIIGIIIGVGAIIVLALIVYFLRHRISWVSITRTGIEMRTNDVLVWSGIVDEIKQTDSNTSVSIRKTTTGLQIIDPEKYAMSADVMLMISEANQPLIYAAYENNHTRKLAVKDKGIENYIADKVHDVSAALRIWKLKFPELTDEVIKEHVRRWIKKAIIPALRLACNGKLDFYCDQIKRDDVSMPLKGILQWCITKNAGYIDCIKELSEHSDIKVISSIIQPTS